MKKVLSIDFDYFLDTDIDTREDKFPEGDESIEPNWKYWCEKYPEINVIGVIDSYYKLLKFLKTQNPRKFLYADSHGEIARLFDDFSDDMVIDHYDFHHDNWFGNSEVNCANWVRRLKCKYPNAKVIWHYREDSITNALDGEFPYEKTLDDSYSGKYDIIFMCFSPEWTPPHFRGYYKDLIRALEKK